MVIGPRRNGRAWRLLGAFAEQYGIDAGARLLRPLQVFRPPEKWKPVFPSMKRERGRVWEDHGPAGTLHKGNAGGARYDTADVAETITGTPRAIQAE